MKSALSSLQEKRDAFDKMKKNYEDTVAYIEVCGIPLCFYMWRSQCCFQAVLTPLSFQIQARFVERRTREEFDKLHSFLQAEEEAQMAALAAEEEQRRRAMMQKIEEITREITSVSESIRVLEEEIVLDGISVLHVRFVNVSLSSWTLL